MSRLHGIFSRLVDCSLFFLGTGTFLLLTANSTSMSLGISVLWWRNDLYSFLCNGQVKDQLLCLDLKKEKKKLVSSQRCKGSQVLVKLSEIRSETFLSKEFILFEKTRIVCKNLIIYLSHIIY